VHLGPHILGIGAQSTLGGTTFLPEKNMYEKLTKCQNFTRFLPENARIIARKIFFPIFFFWGGARAVPPFPTPMLVPMLNEIGRHASSSLSETFVLLCHHKYIYGLYRYVISETYFNLHGYGYMVRSFCVVKFRRTVTKTVRRKQSYLSTTLQSQREKRQWITRSLDAL